MRQDKSISQRLKLRRAADSFDFNALIEGVSTLAEEEASRKSPAESTVTVAEQATITSPPFTLPRETGGALFVPQPVGPSSLSEPLAPPPVSSEPAPVADVAEAVFEPSTEQAIEAEIEVAAEPEVILEAEAAPVPAHPARAAQLRKALDTLSARLVDEAARMGAAMRSGDADAAGFYLAHTNQVLEILSTLDPSGDLSRDLGTHNAPPQGRAWPSTAWSVVEFADSPFSALLPQDADEDFVEDLVYASWGVERS